MDFKYKRFIITGHEVEDLADGKIFVSRDKALIHIANVLYSEMQDIKKEMKKK
jgi:hypothetical protein